MNLRHWPNFLMSLKGKLSIRKLFTQNLKVMTQFIQQRSVSCLLMIREPSLGSRYGQIQSPTSSHYIESERPWNTQLYMGYLYQIFPLSPMSHEKEEQNELKNKKG